MAKKSKRKKVLVKEKAVLREITPELSAKELHIIVYWTTLLVMFLANIFMAMAIIPLVLLASGFDFYVIISALGLLFGFIFSLLINNIENLKTHHHVIATLTIPFFAVVNLMIISVSLAGLTRILGVAAQKEPLTVSLVYAVFFLLPYTVSMARKRV